MIRILYIVASALLIVYCLIFYKTRNYLPSEAPITASDGIVLLAGHYSERVPNAAELFNKGAAPRIILTNDGVRGGWSSKHQRNLYSIERSEELLVQLGVPREAIIKLPFNKSGTIYDALAVKKYAGEHSMHSIHLVTSDYHAYRAVWVFKRVFGDLPVTIGITPAPSPMFSLPSLKEPFKLVYYWVRY
ncbi:MAG: YdcF family protein [Desulfuromonadales bacterium]